MALDFDGGDEDNIVYGNYVTMHGNGGNDQLGSNATVFTQIYGGADNDGVYYYGPSTSALYGGNCSPPMTAVLAVSCRQV